MKNIIKQFNVGLALITFSFFFLVAACSNDDEQVEPTVKIPDTVLSSGMTFAKAGGTQTLSVLSNVPLEVTSDKEWCAVTHKGTTAKGTYTYQVAMEANPDTDSRTAAISVVANGEVVGTVTVTQTAADGLLIEDALPITVTGEGGNITVHLKANGNYVIDIKDAWIKQSVQSRAMTDKTETFAISANYGEERTGTISFTLGTVTEEVTVKQAAGSLPDIGMESDAKTLASKMYAGINIGNTLEVPNGQNWGNNATVSEAYIKGLKTLGFNAVRIPCAWSSHADATTYEIDAEWLNKVADAVNLCLINDMYAIVNIHWDGGWLEDNIISGYSEAINTKQKTLWTQIATKFKDYDEHLLFAGCNEPGMNETSSNDALMTVTAKQTIMKYEQTFVDAVRATGGNNATRCLIVQIPATRISAGLSDFSMPTDVVSGRLMVEAHFYDPYQFCLMEEDANWGKVFWYWGTANHVNGSEHNATSGSEENYVQEQFQKMKETFVDAGYPVIIGEYSAMKRTVSENQEKHNASRAYWNEVVTREAKSHGIVPFYWETNGDINRSTGEAKEKYAIDGIMKGAAAGNYPY